MAIATVTNTVEAALMALADARAWTARDEDFGNSLAAQVKSGRTLTERQRFAGHRLTGTYRQQLASVGIDYGAIALPAPPPPKTAGRTIDLDTDSESFAVTFPFDAALLTAIKAMPDRPTWNPTLRVWMVPWSEDNTVAMAAFVERYRFTCTQPVLDLLARADAMAEAQREMTEEMIAQSMAAAADLDIPGLGGELRPFQKAGVKYALAQKRVIIADEPGLGKTIEALATIHAMNAYPAVVVVPASVRENWRREARKWLPGKRIGVIKGRAPSENATVNLLFTLDVSADLLIIGYDVLGSWVSALRARNLKAVVLDEAHRIKTPGAKRTKAARVLARGVPIVLLLTGTPVLNRPQELISQLQVIGRLAEPHQRPGPDMLGTTADFQRRYVDRTTNLTELNAKLRALCFIRRLKSQVLTELPPKVRSVVPIEIDNREEYMRAERELIEYLRGIDPHKAERAMWAEQLVKISVLKQLVARGKMAQAHEWVGNFLETGSKLIAFGWHQDIVRELARPFGADIIIGGQSDQERQRIVDAFQNDPAKRLIVANIQAGGEGITLTAASNVAFLELGWNPATHDQATDRAHRIGQRDSVTAYYLMAPRTIEEKIMALIEAKSLIVDATTDGRIMDRGGSIVAALIESLRHDATKEGDNE